MAWNFKAKGTDQIDASLDWFHDGRRRRAFLFLRAMINRGRSAWNKMETVKFRELIARVPCETIATDKLGGDRWKKFEDGWNRIETESR